MSDFWSDFGKGFCGVAAAFGLASCATTEKDDKSILDQIVPVEDLGLRGPDQNNDGVRDYIADYLVEVYAGQGPAASEKAATLIGLARSTQFQIENANDPRALFENANNTVLPYISCIVAMRDEIPMQDVLGEIRYLSTNTSERAAAYERAQRNMSGGVFRSGDTSRGHDVCPSYLRG